MFWWKECPKLTVKERNAVQKRKKVSRRSLGTQDPEGCPHVDGLQPENWLRLFRHLLQLAGSILRAYSARAVGYQLAAESHTVLVWHWYFWSYLAEDCTAFLTPKGDLLTSSMCSSDFMLASLKVSRSHNLHLLLDCCGSSSFCLFLGNTWWQFCSTSWLSPHTPMSRKATCSSSLAVPVRRTSVTVGTCASGIFVHDLREVMKLFLQIKPPGVHTA